MDIDRIRTAFHPAIETTDPRFFAGRVETIKKSILALGEPGSFIAVHGLRGIGKSSIAKQIQLIAEGDDTLINIHQFGKYVPKRSFNYLTVYHSCDTSTLNVSILFQRLLQGYGSTPLYSFTKQGNKHLISETRDKSAGIKFGLPFGLSAEGNSKNSETFQRDNPNDPIQMFVDVLTHIRKDNLSKSGLLIIIDEFDTLKDKTGFANLVKNYGDDFVKFMVVGIASDINELVQDHESISRQLRPIKVGKMDDLELWEIITKAERYINKNIEFTDDSAELMVKHADGFPYFMHLLGSEAFLLAFENGDRIIHQGTMQEIYNKISSGNLSTIYEENYHNAVKNSPDREILLKLFSEDKDEEINITGIYKLAKEFGIRDPSALMKGLTSPERPILIKIRDKHYRFSDPVFKVYSRIRTLKFK
ncbi:MAG TPA: hypothetical protein VHA56_19970 [Mucilaginibacter sp.]|nr:hypothetical protein [Mucilaginibacter sp.]